MDRRTSNQDIQILIEIKNIMEQLLNKTINQVTGIDTIKQITFPNQHLSEKISTQIITKYYEVILVL